jgi:hypothetical protein
VSKKETGEVDVDFDVLQEFAGCVSSNYFSNLGGVVVTVLVTGPKSRGFKPDRSKGDKNPQHTFLRIGSKAGGPMS